MLFLFEEQSLEINNFVLIESLKFHIEEGEHLAIIGENGIGKSTLLDVIHKKHNVNSAYMEQDLSMYEHMTGLEYVMTLYPELLSLRKNLTEVESLNAYNEKDGFLIETQIITAGKKLGLEERHFENLISSLSGGEQTKVSLLKTKLSNADLLIIDEPTNHMDQQMKQWLIQFFNSEGRAILYVSHDKTFLKKTPHAILELTKSGANRYSGTYADFKQQKELQYETDVKIYEKQQKEIQHLHDVISQYKEWYNKAESKASVRNPYAQKQLSKMAKQFKAREKKMNEKINQKQIEDPNEKEKCYSIKYEKFRPDVLVDFKDVTFKFENYEVFNQINFHIKRNQKVVIEGENGAGKSTLIQLMLGEKETSEGQITVHPDLNIGYFSQNFSNLDEEHTLLDEIMLIPDMKNSDARTILASFNFDENFIFKKIKTLSMGEKCRLQFVKLYFSNPHLLILDEPTNYFDINMQDKIINLLKSFQGSLLLISHDDYFKKSFKDEVWTIKNKKIINENLIINQPLNTDKIINELNELEKYTDERNKETDF